MVHLSIGGNDFLNAGPADIFETIVLFLQVLRDIDTVVSHIHAMDPEIRIAFSIHDYVNTGDGFSFELSLFTRIMQAIAGNTRNLNAVDTSVSRLFDEPAGFDTWAVKWRARLQRERRDDGERQQAMRAVNPAFIARNHRVEEVIQAALAGDYSHFETLLEVLSRPFDDDPHFDRFALPPEPHQVVQQTYCGT